MKNLNYLWLCALLGTAATNAVACYTVYDRSDRVIYHAQVAPVDMSQPLHETLPTRFPGGHMVFDTTTDCPAITTLAARTSGGTASPLLTDERTAQAQRLPHTVLAGGIVLVQPGEARMSPGLTVVPAVAVAARPAGAGTVITEMRDDPSTATRSMGAGRSR